MILKKYDNFFNPSLQRILYNFITNSYYKIGWDDSPEVQHRKYPCLHSLFSTEDVEKLNILPTIFKKIKHKQITMDNFDKCIINLSKNLDVNFIHNHPNQMVILHYSNLTWNPEWGGETVFYKNNARDILESNPYIPNRAILFDGEINHTIKAQNMLGPCFRFTMSLFFNILK